MCCVQLTRRRAVHDWLKFAAECAWLRAQEFLQALYIIADECGMELVDAAVQLGADPAHLQGVAVSLLLCDTATVQYCDAAIMQCCNSMTLQQYGRATMQC